MSDEGRMDPLLPSPKHALVEKDALVERGGEGGTQEMSIAKWSHSFNEETSLI